MAVGKRELKLNRKQVPQRLLGPKHFSLDRLLALFASIYAEHADRPPDLTADDDSSEDEVDWLASADVQRLRVEKRRRREEEREERWDDEVWGLCMSTKVWSLVSVFVSRGIADQGRYQILRGRDY